MLLRIRPCARYWLGMGEALQDELGALPLRMLGGGVVKRVGHPALCVLSERFAM